MSEADPRVLLIYTYAFGARPALTFIMELPHDQPQEGFFFSHIAVTECMSRTENVILYMMFACTLLPTSYTNRLCFANVCQQKLTFPTATPNTVDRWRALFLPQDRIVESNCKGFPTSGRISESHQ
jgi:hypothetical protein